MRNFYAKRRIIEFDYDFDSSVFKSQDGQNKFIILNEVKSPVTYTKLCIAVLDNKSPKINDTICVINNFDPIYIDEIVDTYVGVAILKSGKIEALTNCWKILATNKIEGVQLPFIEYKTLYETLVLKKNTKFVYVSLLSKINLPVWILKILDKFNIFGKYFETQKFYLNNVFLDIVVKK